MNFSSFTYSLAAFGKIGNPLQCPPLSNGEDDSIYRAGLDQCNHVKHLERGIQEVLSRC